MEVEVIEQAIDIAIVEAREAEVVVVVSVVVIGTTQHISIILRMAEVEAEGEAEVEAVDVAVEAERRPTLSAGTAESPATNPMSVGTHSDVGPVAVQIINRTIAPMAHKDSVDPETHARRHRMVPVTDVAEQGIKRETALPKHTSTARSSSQTAHREPTPTRTPTESRHGARRTHRRRKSSM